MPRDIIVLKRPASREKDMWKEALPIGCGITGGLILGAIEKEQVIITRHDLWHKWANIIPAPDISDSFRSMRKKMDEGEYFDACHMMENALREKEFNKTGAPSPFPLGSLKLSYIKELFGNLIKIVESGYCRKDISKESTAKWKKLTEEIPDYEINEDGAVKEWMSEKFSDNYDHRHFSHLYPVFPGTEVTTENNSSLIKAFKKAGDMRISGTMAGWSFPHLGLIQTRFGDGNKALSNIITMAKGIVLDNFFTLHNDWRHMGMGINVDHMTPVQLDALMGTVALIQDMLFQYKDSTIHILPAKPDRMKYIKAEGLTFPGGKVSFELNEGKLHFSVTAYEEAEIAVKVGCYKEKIKLTEDESYEKEIYL